MSLIARHLEENGIPTVIIGTARDIVMHCGVPRFVFVDFPLGNPCGEPFDVEMQQRIVGAALDVLETATEPRTMLDMRLSWPRGEAWKDMIFTADQPFMSEEVKKKWEARKQAYRDQKAEA